MSSLRRRIAVSDHPATRALRSLYRFIVNFSLPAPAILVRPALAVFLAVRSVYYFVWRVIVCEPLFKAYCTKYGRGVRTGVYIHWIMGSGRLVLGDDVLVDGKCSIQFAVRYAENPTLSIGDHSIISHGCSFTIGREITIGKHVMIAAGTRIFDAPGHPTDPVLRKAGNPANPEDVRAVRIEDDAWIGTEAVIFPGVTIGEGSVVAVRSVVTRDVPRYTIVAGNPAREIGRLTDPNAAPAQYTPTESTAEDTYELPAESVVGAEPIRSETSGATIEAVTHVVTQFLGIDHLDPDDDFYEAGVTSIMTLPLLIELEDRFRISIPQDRFLESPTIRTLAAEIDQLMGPTGAL